MCSIVIVPIVDMIISLNVRIPATLKITFDCKELSLITSKGLSTVISELMSKLKEQCFSLNIVYLHQYGF